MGSTIAARITGSVAFFHEFQEKPEFLLISIKENTFCRDMDQLEKKRILSATNNEAKQ